jgi:hypothetical protein
MVERMAALGVFLNEEEHHNVFTATLIEAELGLWKALDEINQVVEKTIDKHNAGIDSEISGLCPIKVSYRKDKDFPTTRDMVDEYKTLRRRVYGKL